MPALDHVNKDGTIYEIVPEIAPLFNTSTAYAVGDCVIKDAVLYRFKTAHAAGAWNSSEVDAINLSEEVTNLKQDLKQSLNDKQTFRLYGNFQHYGLNTDGTFLTSQKYRVSCDKTEKITFNRDITVSVASGFRWGYIPFVDNTAGSWSGWKMTDFTIPANTIFVVQISRTTEDTSEIADVSEFVNAVTFLTQDGSEISNIKFALDCGFVNLFNRNAPDVLRGQYYSDGTTLNTNASLGQTGLIPVSVGKFYTCSILNSFVLEYDSNKDYVGKYASSNMPIYGHIEIPSGVAYCRFMFTLATENTFAVWQVTKGNNIIDGVPILQEVKNARGGYQNLNDRFKAIINGGAWSGKSGVAFGTSLTYRSQSTGGYLQYLPTLCGATIENQGLGSSVILNNGSQPNMLAVVKAYNGYSSKDFAILEGFVNDWYYNGDSIGTWKDTTETTVCGCVRSALTYILSQNPNLTVMLIIDPVGKSASGVDCSSLAERSNMTQKEFYDEVAKVAENIGIPVIRVDELGGMSENTPYMYIDNIHPSPEGAEQTANTIWSVMKNIPNKIADVS